MSRYYKKPTYGDRHKQLQWINNMVGLHDMHCYCDKPLQHIITGIIEHEPSLHFDTEDSKKIQKCLSTTAIEDVLDDFGEGELEKLFSEDVGEPDATAEETG